MHEKQVDRDIQLKALVENAHLTSRWAVRVKTETAKQLHDTPVRRQALQAVLNDNRRRRCHCAAMCAARLAPAAGRLPSCYDWREAQSVCGVRTEEDGEMREARGRCQPEVGMGRRWRSGITASPSNARRSGPARRTPGRRAKRLPWSAAGPPRLPRPPRPRHSGGD